MAGSQGAVVNKQVKSELEEFQHENKQANNSKVTVGVYAMLSAFVLSLKLPFLNFHLMDIIPWFASETSYHDVFKTLTYVGVVGLMGWGASSALSANKQQRGQ